MIAMRKSIILVCLASVCAATVSAHDKNGLDALWEKGNTLYANGDYNGAIVIYDSIVNTGYHSSKLYYNLGNAYFKNDNLGKSIVNYNRALRLAPSDDDIKYNLAVANSYIKDRIETVPEFFLSGWTKKLRLSVNTNAWAVWSLVFLAIAFAGILVYFLADTKKFRKAGFFVAIAMIILFLLSLSFSLSGRKDLRNGNEAIVVTSAVAVKSSPDSGSKDLFIIHEGTKTEVLGNFGGWTEIMIANGNKGWVLSAAIEVI